MIIPYHHPYHVFKPIDLPPVPSASGAALPVVVCTRCGVMGVVDSTGMSARLVGRYTAQKAQQCTGQATRPHNVLVVSDDPQARNAALSPMTAHPLMLPPLGAADTGVSVWVATTTGPAQLYPWEFQPMPEVRTRRRA